MRAKWHLKPLSGSSRVQIMTEKYVAIDEIAMIPPKNRQCLTVIQRNSIYSQCGVTHITTKL